MFQLTTEAEAYYYNTKRLQYICQSKLFEKLVKIMSFLKKNDPFLMLITLIHITYKVPTINY